MTRLDRPSVALVAVSFLVLFQEMVLIRWLPSQIRVLAYFPNLILLSAFLGLGLGCLAAKRRILLWTWPVSILGLAVAAALLSRVAFTNESETEHLWLLYRDLPKEAPVVGEIRLPILLFFVLGCLAFIPWGQQIALRLQAFTTRGRPLWGYGCDIVGSILGVAAFAIVGFSGLFPVYWFAGLFLIGAFFFTGSRQGKAALAAVAALTLLTVAGAEKAERYSPYYAIGLHKSATDNSFELLANGSLHQVAVGLKNDGVTPTRSLRHGYHVPYGLLGGHHPRRALVIGAGTGNDVSVLLDEGVNDIDAVEIDPRILEIGAELHPDRPYSAPGVHRINLDARSYLNHSTRRYDLIIFGTLDSMTQLSALSSVRLDNFVYTLDCLRAAKALLTDRGGLVLYFMVGSPFIDLRLSAMIAEVFGELPVVDDDSHGMFNRIYMAGPAFAGQDLARRQAAARAFVEASTKVVELPSDDWPFLYLKARGLTPFYWSLIAILTLLALAAILLVSKDMRRSVARLRPDVEMFLFGVAFLLLETSLVTAMTLVWGSTWLTSAVVFGSVLCMVLAATVVAAVRPLNAWLCYLALAVILVVDNQLIRPEHLLASSGWVKLGLSILYVGLPVFFASLSFSRRYQQRPDSTVAFGWNLLGAMAGGLLEFSSMVLGFKALLLVTLAAYLGTFLVYLRGSDPMSEEHGAAAGDVNLS